MTERIPLPADMDPCLRPLSEQDIDLAVIDIVVKIHLHFDHCGCNHLFVGKPIDVQRQELEDARSQDGYTIPEWVDAPGVEYVSVDGELELASRSPTPAGAGSLARHAGGRRRDRRPS